MRIFICCLFLFPLLFLCVAFSQERIDVIYFKNGDIRKGIIIENVPNNYIRIETKDGSIFTIKYSEIQKMTKEAPSSIQKSSMASKIPLGNFCIRGGVGTDINLGLGIGIGGAYVWNSGEGIAFELGADIYLHNSTDKYTEERGVTVTGEDKTSLTVFGIRANALFNYQPAENNVYFIAGLGFVVSSLQWEETENAPNWTTPYHDKKEGTSAGNIINLGVGISVSSNLDLRFETPMLFFYSVPGKAASFAPTATIGLTYRFD